MGSAIGNSSSGRDHGSHYYDVRDFGAVPQATPTAAGEVANLIAFQLAIDTAVANRGSLGGAKIYVPSGDWYLAGPVFVDQNSIEIVGDGPGATSVYNNGYSDIFILGMKRQATGAPATPDHFPDAFTGGPGGTPIYDSSAVTALGQRWGIRTKGDAHVCQQGGPLDRGTGDGYRSTRQLTIATFIDFTRAPTTIPSGYGSAQFPASGSIMGMVTANIGYPWMMYVSNNLIYLSLSLVDANGLNQFSFQFPIYTFPVTPGLLKLDIQIDLVKAQISVYANGIQTQFGGIPARFTAAANLYFLTNEMNPFCIGSTKDTMYGVADAVGAPIDCTFWGLKVCAGLIYTNRNTAGTNDNAGNGTTQTRLDAYPISDFIRYFFWEGWTGTNEICRMTFQDSPASIGVNSLVNTAIGGTSSQLNAFFCDNNLTANVFVGPLIIRDMGLYCRSPNYGRSLALGLVNGLLIDHCNFTGGHQNVGALNVGTNYPITIQDCNFGSTDACIYLHMASSVVISRCNYGNATAQIRLYFCNVRIEYGFCSSQASPDYNIWSKNGGILDIFQFVQDAEGVDAGPTKAMVYMVASNGLANQGLGGILKIDTLVGGRQPTGSALVWIEDGLPENGYGYRTCRFSMVNTDVEDNFCTTLVRNNGQRWRGEVIASTTPPRPTWIENTDVTGQGNVVSIHDHFIGVPRDGTWGKNANILKVVQPAIGQFTEWRCTGTGTYGTAVAPSWYGMLPIDDGLGLATYLQDTAYWAVPTMPPKGQGVWGLAPAVQFLGALFGGPVPATPPGLYVGLAFRPAYRAPTVYEMRGIGYGYNYARAATGAWTLTGANATNANTIAFSTAAQNWDVLNYFYVFNSLVFYDALTGGNYIGGIDISPRTILSGQTVSYAPGALTVGKSTSSLGGFADSINFKRNGFYLNQTPFTVPTIYVALSTAPASLSAPTEPSGGGYARIATSAASWHRNEWSYPWNGSLSQVGIVTNALPLTFAAPTGGWGTVQSVYLMDAAVGGNVIGSANLAIPRTILAGSPARSFAVGAFWISSS